MKWRVAYIKNEGSTRSYTLMQVMIRLLKWCNRKAIRLVPVHQADAVSRIGQILNTEWMLAMERLRPVFYKWGEPQIDMFATFSNRRLIKFVSPYPHPRAEWTDAMSTTGGASCTHSRHWSWSLRCYRRSNSLMECKWFLWLHCKKQLTGIRSFWNYRKKIRSHCTSKVNHC